MDNNTVWEYTEKASKEYIGTRFITNSKEDQKSDEKHILIAKNLSYEDAIALVNVKKEKNIEAYLSSMPEEYRALAKDLLT